MMTENVRVKRIEASMSGSDIIERRQVDAGLAIVADRAEQLQGLQHRLADRLVTVMRPPGVEGEETECAGAMPEPVLCPVAWSLKNIAQRLAVMCDHIEYLLDRLEV